MIELFKKRSQAYGEFNNGEIIENKPIGFPQDNGELKAYSPLFYWAFAEAHVDSTIGLHPHRGFEIMTIVLEGQIEHYDTLLNKWNRLQAGDMQVIHSGSGVSHAERLFKGAKLFQIWLDPDLSKSLALAPNYQDYSANQFKIEKGEKQLIGKNAPATLLTPAIEMIDKQINKGKFEIPIETGYYYSIYLIKGEIKWGKKTAVSKDFIRVYNAACFTAEAIENSRLLYIKSPIKPSYKGYPK